MKNVFTLFILILLFSCKTSKNKTQIEQEHLKSFDAYKTPAPASLQSMPSMILCFDSANKEVLIDTMSFMKAKKICIVFFDPSCVECNMLGKQFKENIEKLNSEVSICYINIIPTEWKYLQNYRNAYTANSSQFHYFQRCTETDLGAFGTISLTPTLFYFENGSFKEKHEVSLSEKDFIRLFQ